MGSLNIAITKEMPPSDVFADMPEAFRSFLNRGFDQLAQIDQSRIGPLAKLFAEGLNVSDDAGVVELVRRLDLPVRDKASFGAAISMLIIFVTSRDDLDDVISAGGNSGVIPKGSVDRIIAIARELGKSKVHLVEAVENSSLANEVAPSFQSLNIVVELRFRFDDSKISRMVPVAICHLDTDLRSNQCFFQMKKSDITQLITQLQKAESQFNVIDAWAKDRR
jgi:hypothetical protein